MDIKMILQELDSLFTTHKIKKVEPFLLNMIDKAQTEQDVSSQVTLLNELIGHYRDMGEYEQSICTCQKVMELLATAGLNGSIAYATTLQNVANALRAAGQLEASMMYYNQVFAVYQNQLELNDMRYASLSNNMSLLYQEMEDYENACICLENALSIVMQHPNAMIEVATTHTNLATSLLKLGNYEEAMLHLERAFDIFQRDADKNYHYSGALAAMAEAKYMSGHLNEAIYYYQEALREIEKNVGVTENYKLVERNLQSVYESLGQAPRIVSVFENGLQLCEEFYKEYGAPMIREQFPQYEKMIAVGLVGEGSDCFGYDDEISRDHDFGPGFCMWLTDAVYDEIGEKLQKSYDKLPSIYMGVMRHNTMQAGKRLGVFRIGDFYKYLIGTKDVPESNHQWLFVEDYQLAVATNGKVFRDDLGEFTRIRKGLLSYYPETVTMRKIAREATLMAQSGQYNYGRMLLRKDKVTAHIAVIEFIKHTMSMVYLLNRVYAPFYKWQYHGMKKLTVLPQIRELLWELEQCQVGEQEISFIIEKITSLIIAQMKMQGLTQGESTYLDNHSVEILASIERKQALKIEEQKRYNIEKKTKEELVEQVVCMEWEQFDKVEHIGGQRADCQDDWNTFSVMRKSQFLAWTEELLLSYRRDFEAACERGWNMVMEKYGRMMISTDTVEYNKICVHFPTVSEEKAAIIEEIVKIQVSWMEAFAQEYPKSAGAARSIHTYEDSMYNTSYETYLRGELTTYSDETVQLYGRFIVGLYNNDENLAVNIITNTALLYGYESLKDMEESL